MGSDSLDFPDLPPFPSNVPTAPLLRLSLQKLIDGEDEETNRLWKACKEVGFFYLDLRDAKGTTPESDGQTINGHANGSAISSRTIDGNEFVKDAYSLFDIGKEFSMLPIAEKEQFDLKSRGSYHGYRPTGQGIVDANGTRDRAEFFNLSKDDILKVSPGAPPLPIPEMFNPHRPLIASYMTSAHTIITLILARLNTLLELPENTLTQLHAFNSPAGDQTRIVRSPPQPQRDRSTALGAHTDFGSVTLLFNRLGGLQIMPPDTDGLSQAEKADRWLWVRPLQGHCIVNLGDAMVKFTRGLLRSNEHRVVNPPGEQEQMERMSVVYFARPCDDVLLKPLEGSSIIDARKEEWEDEGPVLTSKDWVLRRSLGNREGKFVKGTEGSRGKMKNISDTARGLKEVEAN